MSRGLGWVQAGCLDVLREHQGDEEPLTTYDIAGLVYKVKPNADNIMIIDDAPYVATKRALEGLRRKGLVINQRPGNYRLGPAHSWRLAK